MAIREILRYPHDALKKKAELWSFDGSKTDGSLLSVVQDMRDTLLATSSGVALAANQIGCEFNLFVVKDHGKLSLPSEVFINPSWSPMRDEHEKMNEGCLSFPGISLEIKRFKFIMATFQGIDGAVNKTMLGGFAARVFQHETEHLSGRSFIDDQRNMVKVDVMKQLARTER